MRWIAIIAAVAVLGASGCAQKEPEGTSESISSTSEVRAEGKKAVLIIAHSNFRDEELAEPEKIFEDAGVEVTIASSSLDPATGMLGATVEPDILVNDVKVDDYDAIVFVGGAGSQEYWDSAIAHKIAKATVESGKILGAICIAPVTLARAGVLDGKKATVWKSEGEALTEHGAQYTGASVEVDGSVITADGPKSAKAFGEKLVEALTK